MALNEVEVWPLMYLCLSLEVRPRYAWPREGNLEVSLCNQKDTP